MPQFSEMPTLGQFIERVKKFGVTYHHTPDLAEGPRGPVRFYYLKRSDKVQVVMLPNVSHETRLQRHVVEAWCRTFDIPLDEFGL